MQKKDHGLNSSKETEILTFRLKTKIALEPKLQLHFGVKEKKNYFHIFASNQNLFTAKPSKDFN